MESIYHSYMIDIALPALCNKHIVYNNDYIIIYGIYPMFQLELLYSVYISREYPPYTASTITTIVLMQNVKYYKIYMSIYK